MGDNKFSIRGVSAWHIVLLVLEFGGYILLVSHYLPEDSLKKWNENGMVSIILMGIFVIILIFIQLRFFNTYRFELKSIEDENKKGQAILNQQIVSLKSDNYALHRLARYTEVFPHLNQAFSSLHRSLRNSEFSHEDYEMIFTRFCITLAHIYSDIKGSQCHVCMKVIVKPAKGKVSVHTLKAKTLVRDNLSVGREKIDSIAVNHLLCNNSDYEYIFENIRTENSRYFFDNNLVIHQNYKNTSFIPKTPTRTFTYSYQGSEEDREKHWPLPYKSIIVVPICPGIQEERDHHSLLGFLAIDATEKNVFDEKIDTEILCGCADAIYNPLKQALAQAINKRNKTTQS